MKIAVYAICKNEEKFVSRFMTHAKEADLVVVTDTGSTDNTINLLIEQGAIVKETNVTPWRFDVARNISLENVPNDVDVCVCVDLDEILPVGWRKKVEDAWTSNTTRLKYKYIWGPGTEFWYDKIHIRKGYTWVKPVHEILLCSNEEVITYCDGFTLVHEPDLSKSRASYLPLLEMGCKEDPADDRNSHYLGREYMYRSEWDKSIAELIRHLSLPKAIWNAERCSSMRFISRCYIAKNDLNLALVWALRACAENPTEREPWIDLGKVYYNLSKMEGVYFAIKQALAITEKSMHYINEPDSWNEVPYDYISTAAWIMGLHKESFTFCQEAAKLNPNNKRLIHNLEWMIKYFKEI